MKGVIKKVKGHMERFSRWMRSNPPVAASTDEWHEFETRFKKEAPIRYFLMETIPTVWRKYSAPLRAVGNIADFIRYRVVRYHVVDSGLPPAYYDKDQLMLHANFNILKEFVEVELAWRHFTTVDRSDEIWKYRWIPYYRAMFFREPECGIKHLEWEATLDSPEQNMSDAEIDGNRRQAQAAREKLELYRWWTEVRPSREEREPLKVAPEMEERIAEAKKKYGSMYALSSKFAEERPDEHEAITASATSYFDWERHCEEEDQFMLHRLIHVRTSLWT